MIEFLSQPWPWYVAGPIIAITMFLMLYSGREFGVSATLRDACAMVGGGKASEFFKIDWKKNWWNIVFVFGGALGGFIAINLLPNPDPIALSANTVRDMQALGIESAGETFVPLDIFSWSGLASLKGIIMIVVGGFLVGFGARYAGGCTSGHAISGLSNLQLPSLIAVVGFFIGGLAMTYLLLPLILKL